MAAAAAIHGETGNRERRVCWVLADEETDAESTYQIVGTDEADIAAGLLSITSPLGRALISKSVGDSVDVTTPRGLKSYEIVKVSYK